MMTFRNVVLASAFAEPLRLVQAASWDYSNDETDGSSWGLTKGDTCAEESSGDACGYISPDKIVCCLTIADTNGYPAIVGECPTTDVPSTLNDPTKPSGCSYVTYTSYGTNMVFNDHPNGAGHADYQPLCRPRAATECCAATDPFECRTPPTPAPQSVSGDPILKINGRRIKFDMPVGQDVLLVGNGDALVIGRADLLTPDNQNQWFSRIAVAEHQIQVAVIERKALTSSSIVDNARVNSLHLSIGNEDVHKLGTYHNGKIVVKRGDKQLGHVPKDIVQLTLGQFKITVSPEVAKKFKDLHKALRYVHLDLTLHDIQAATAGIFAEFYGYVPMSSKTAALIRSVKQ